MSIQKEELAQESNFTATAGVSPEGRRPKGDTPAESPQKPQSIPPDVQVKSSKQRAPRRKFTTTYKLKILEAYDACDNALARGALLRKEGLYHSRLSTWRKQRDEGKLKTKSTGKTPKSVLQSQQLARENAQLKKKLAQAEAIIDIQKKISELLGTHTLPVDNNEIN